MSKKQRAIDSFFGSSGNQQHSGSPDLESPNPQSPPTKKICLGAVGKDKPDTSTSVLSKEATTPDISVPLSDDPQLSHDACADKPVIDISQCTVNLPDDDAKYRLIKGRTPPVSYTFPSKVYPDKGKKSGVRTRSCQHQWFAQFEFITYSSKEHGLYCLPCVLFPVENSTSSRAKQLISKSYNNWKDATNDLRKHAACDYHKTSAQLMQNFTNTTENAAARIDLRLDNSAKEQVAKNREILNSILRCIEFCGRQGISLRGHRDDDTSDNANVNHGNFKALLELCSTAGDTTLKEHIEMCSKNAKYTSKTAQYDLLLCMKEFIQEHIISEIKAQTHGPFFGVQADEVTDCCNKEQLGIVLRYLVNDQPVERLIEFIECEKITGEALANLILQKIDSIGLDMEVCRSQSYDGAGNMAGATKGCAARIAKLHSKALYYYCMNHDLNLAVSKSCKLPEMQVMLDTVKQVGLFFKYSPKKQTCLEKSGTEINMERKNQQDDTGEYVTLIKLHKVKTLCETRWVERHTSVQDMKHMYSAIIHCLESISSGRDNWDAKSVTEANGLLMHLTNPKFIIVIHVYLRFSGYLKSLSQLLQGPSQDIIVAHGRVSLVLEELKSVRDNADEAFGEVWQEAGTFAGKENVNIELSMPRKCGRQSLRNNVEADSPITYWNRAVFVPYLDHLIMEFNSRFTHASSVAARTLCMLPSNLEQLKDKEISDIKNFYANDLPSPSTFLQEIALWKREWNSAEEKPNSIQGTLSAMSVNFYPNITQILRLLLMLPVSAASVERSNSALKGIKTKKRSTLGSDNMNALVLLYAHKTIPLNYGTIIDKYARKHPRRMVLLNPMSNE